jgi:hypothetical protein
MKLHRRSLPYCLALCFLFLVPAEAEEFYLKDGTRIVGKIVAYEKDAFRVETSFGSAVILKDRIERIVFDQLTAGEARRQKPLQPATKSDPSRSAPPPKSRGQAASAPPLSPDEVVERVTGTAYINETFRFQMYKPPTWRSYPQLVKPDTPLVAALGTPDETTLLLIGREYHRGSLQDYMLQAEQSLEELYEDYREEGEQRTEVGGLSAIQRRFTGITEGRFWTGVAIYFVRGHEYYTLLGLTAAGEQTNLQLAVLRKVANTLEFLP